MLVLYVRNLEEQIVTLDCYEERQMKICKLSFANSYVRAVDASTFINAQQNARLVVNHVKRYATI